MNTIQPVINLQNQNSNKEQKKYLKLVILATVVITIIGAIVIGILFLVLSKSPKINNEPIVENTKQVISYPESYPSSFPTSYVL